MNRWQRGYLMRTLSPAKRLAYYLEPGPNGCVVWRGDRDHTGYGRIRVAGKHLGAHRLAWTVAFGAIPAGRFVLHRCDNPACCNVEHLFVGTHADNMSDMAKKGRAAAGANNGAAKLDAAVVLEIRISPDSQRSIARRLGISKSLVGNIRRGEAWRHLLARQ